MKNPTITKYFITSVFVLFCFTVSAQTKNKIDYKPPTQVEKKLDELRLIQNIRYGAIPEIAADSTSDRILDLYLPATTNKKPLPILVFIHGGGFTGGDKSVTELCSNLAKQGFAVASINYTLVLKYKKDKAASGSANMAKGLPKNGKFYPLLNEAIETASADAVMALSWLKTNAKNYNLDINRVAISGGSAGSMTALYTAYVSKQKVVQIKAVVDLWGGLENVNNIQKDAAPLLIYHGDVDALINVEYAKALKTRMDEIGSTKSEMHIMEGKGHAQYGYIAKSKIMEIATFLRANL